MKQFSLTSRLPGNFKLCISVHSKSRTQTPSSLKTHFMALSSNCLNSQLKRSGNGKSRIWSQKGEVDHGQPSQGSNKEEKLSDLKAFSPEILDTTISHGETGNRRRWHFISKVYSILAGQVFACMIIPTAVIFCTQMKVFINRAYPGVVFCVALIPFLLLWPLTAYRKKYPVNLMMLGLFTICMSIALGLGCAFISVEFVIQGLLMTAVTILSLTGYAIWASMVGKDFGYNTPFWFSCITIFIMTIIIKLFFPVISASRALTGGIEAVILAGFLLYERDKLIKDHTYDEYIEASICLYLDVITLLHNTFHVLRIIVEFHCWFFGWT